MTKSFRRKALLLASCGPAFLFGASVSTLAQGIPQSGVQQPSAIPDEYAPKGLPLDSFRLFPTFDVAYNYDDNVFRTDVDKKGDNFFEFTPRVALESQWAENYLLLRGGATNYTYTSLTHENRTDYDVDGEGRLDILRGYALYGGASYRHTYEPRSSPDQLNIALESTPFNVTHADARIEAKPNRFGVTAGVNFDRYQYDPTQLTATIQLPNHDRNYNEIDGFARLSYEFSPGYSVFGHFAYITRNFDDLVDRNGVNRDSTGYRANGGVEFELTRLVTGELYAGYLQQDYKAPLGTETGFNFGADIKWYLTPLLTMRFGASHLINETVVAYGPNIATASNEARANIGLDYQFRRNIVLHLDTAYLRDQFTGAGRTDNLAFFSLGATYFMNEYMHWDISYILNSRNSNKLGQNFEDNMFRLGLGFQL